MKQPGAGVSVLGKELFLPLEGASISLRFFLQENKTCEVAIYFNRTPHTLSDFTFQYIDQRICTSTNHDKDQLLVTKEAYWSAPLFSLAPFGLNKRQQFQSKNRVHYT